MKTKLMNLQEISKPATVNFNCLGESTPVTFERLTLNIISNRVLLHELKSDKTDLFRKKAIVNAMLFAKKLTEETAGKFPSWIGAANPSGSVPYWFCENPETKLIHVLTDFTKYCYHPGYIFEEPAKSNLSVHAQQYY